jgi:hypothetical protein
MKNVIPLLIVLVLTFTITSCKKKDPQPKIIPVGFRFLQATGDAVQSYNIYTSKNDNNPQNNGGMIPYSNGTTDYCTATHGFFITFYAANRYYYQCKIGSTVKFEGYIDIDANSNVTLTQTLKPSSGPGMEYQKCQNGKNVFILHNQ